MKTRPSRTEQRADARHDLKALQEALRKPLLTEEPFDYAARTRQVEEAQQWNNLASQLRFRPPADPQIWDIHKATAERFWKAMDAAYPMGFWEDCEKLKAGDAAGLETVIRFLEADPYFFRSGYIKAWLIRGIKPSMLKPADIKRLQNVVLSLIDRRDDRDFRAFCKLARKVDSPKLREQLAQRINQGNFDVRRRARWVLEALAQKDSMEQGKKKPK